MPAPHITIAAPAREPLIGNRITARRWTAMLRDLGYRVRTVERWDGRPTDVLIAVHARRSHPSARAFKRAHPDRSLVVVLSGTDAYRDLPDDARARESLRLADRIVTLQADALDCIPRDERSRATTILQSATPTPDVTRPRYRRGDRLEIVQLASLRPVKDPFLIVRALRHLPADVAVRVTHAGPSPTAAATRRAHRAAERDPRYRWLGAVTAARARRLLATSHLAILTSHSEGGANVVAEAAVDRVPLLATRVGGTVGQLGPDYPGYLAVGDARGLAERIGALAADPRALGALRTAMRERASAFSPARERRALAALLRPLCGRPAG